LYAVDITDLAAVHEIIADIHRDLPPLRGVVHAAGITDDGLLTEQTWERVERVLAPKLDGAWNLHLVTRYEALDFFVLYSALAGTLGSSGQSGYSAANSFLDGFAAWRRSLGLPALALDWGPWLEVGMFARLPERHRERWKALGITPLSTVQGLDALGLAMQTRCTRLAIMHPAKTSAFGRLLASPRQQNRPAETPARTTQGEGRSPAAELLERWRRTPPVGRRAVLLAHLGELAARVIGLPSGRSIDPNQPYHEAGLDSLMALEMRNALVHQFGAPQPATLLFDYPTGVALADYLMRVIPALAPNDESLKPALVSSPAARPLVGARQNTVEDADLAALSDAEAADLLAAELEKLKKGN
jgi:acyl carrier protein